MTIIDRVEKLLKLDRIESPSVRVRARAVYVIGLVFAATQIVNLYGCLLYTSPSPRDRQKSRMPSSA